MAKINFKGHMIVLSTGMNMDKTVFENGADDTIFAQVKELFTQNGWSPISDLHHEPNGDDKVTIYIEFTVPQNETTLSTVWLEDTSKLMNLLLHTMCSIIDNNDTLKQVANEFHRVSMENGIILLPAPKKQLRKPEGPEQELIVYDTGDNFKAFNKIFDSKLTSRTVWAQGMSFAKLPANIIEDYHQQLVAIGCEHAVK